MPRRSRKPLLFAALAVALAATTVSGCGPATGKPTASPSTHGPGGATSGPSSGTTPCPAKVATNPAKSDGDHLRVTVEGILSAEGWAVLLPAKALSTPGLLPTGPLPDFDSYFSKAYRAGGFAPGMAIVRMSVRGRSADAIAIYDIRPVNMRRECLPTGAAVIFGNEGGMPSDISFNLEAARPLARETSYDDPSGGRPYFEGHSITVGESEPASVVLRLGAARNAYSFDIAISYELNGAKHTQVVRQNGLPFRVAAELCPDLATRRELSTEDVARLRSMRYEQVRVRKINEADYSYYVVGVDPRKYMDQCATLK